MTNPTPHGQVPASSAVLKAIREANMQLVRTGDDAFMLVPYLQAHVQNPTEIEHVAGDVSKNGAELNVSTQQQECGNTPYDEGPFALAQPAAPQGVAYAALPKDVIRAVFIENGFTVKEGQTDLKQYVYDAANELLRRARLRASHGQAPAGAVPATQQAGEMPESIEQLAVARYKVVPAHESMFHRWAVVAGDGAQQLYLGREVECENMARKFAGAFLDGAFVALQNAAPQPSPTAQAAESVPAEEREKERIAFKDAHRHLELDEVPDAWSRPMFKHSHVEASWLGWIARAARAPAESMTASANGETYHLGACIVDGVLYATMMRKEWGCSGVATVLFSEQIPVEHLQDRDVIFHTTPPAQAADSQPAPEYVGNGMFKGETIEKAAEHWANWCDVRCMTGLSEFLRVVAARAPAESVLEDAERWQWLADYLIGERTDLDEGIVACATIDALRQFADAARKQGGA